MVEARIIAEGIKRGKVERIKGDIEYIRFRESFKGIERGTVMALGRVIWGFPHIKRIFTLEKGIRRNMSAGRIFAEEKIDGFNVRIAFLDGKVFAFSRGGFLDLFVTEKAREMDLGPFFREYPEHVLCGEMIGNTPHTKPEEGFDVKLYVFDIDEGDGEYLPCEERYSILKRFGIPSVPVLGHFKSDDIPGLKRLVISINKGRREGMVLKSADRSQAVKYVTPWSDIEDIERTSGIFFDMPIGFYYQRVLRSAFFINDFGLDKDDYAKKLGRAFYDGLVVSLRCASEGREIGEEFEIAFKDARIWDDIRRHMGKEVKVEEIWRKKENGKTRIRFRKIFRKTTKTLRAYVEGKGITD
ncbi:MAG: RNA ligase [Candidatus Micrarchaeota archaeon]